MTNPFEPSRLKKSFSIHENHIAANGKISPLALMMFLQECASSHAEKLGVGVKELLAQNKTWVLSRFKLILTRFPIRSEQIEVETWPSGTERFFAIRDFILYDGSGESFGKAQSAWVVIDTNNRRPLRVDSFLPDKIKIPYLGSWPFVEKGLPKLEKAETCRRFFTRFRDLDINQHVNNISYMEWAFEGLPWDLLFRGNLKEVEIHFLQESFLGEEICSITEFQSDKNAWFHKIERVSDQKELVRMKSVWEV